MNQYLEVLMRSKNVGPIVDGVNIQNIRKYLVCPDNFELLKEEIVLQGSATEAVTYVQSSTERLGQEHTLVLYGEHRLKSTFLRDYSITVGTEKAAVFQPEQLKIAKQTYKEPNGEVVYAHTHVATGTNYNCFSVNDLLFIVKQAIRNKRDVYGMLISKDGAIPIKYSYSRNEFFRIRVTIA